MEKMQVLTKVQEASRVKNQKLMAEVQKLLEQKIKQMMRKMLAANQKLFEATTEKLQEN